jgi:hypothetical protein
MTSSSNLDDCSIQATLGAPVSAARPSTGGQSLRVKEMSIQGCQSTRSSDRFQRAVIDRRSGAIVSVDRTRAVGVSLGCAAAAMSPPPAKWKTAKSSIVTRMSPLFPALSKLRARYALLAASGSPMLSARFD